MPNKVTTIIKAWSADNVSCVCPKCGLPPGREFMAQTDQPIMHPHLCGECSSVVYMPGPVFQCPTCSGASSITGQAA